jgi:hypothetical protein
MKTVNKEILGFSVGVVGVAETIPEFVEAAGSEERLVDLANNYVLFHQHFTKLRNAIVKTLVELTGIKLETEEKDGKTIITETAEEYVGRLEEESANPLQFADQVNSAVGAMPVDYKQPVRGLGTTKVAQKWLAYYDAMVEAGKLDAFVEKHDLTLPADEEAAKIVVANKVKEIVTHAQQAALKTALA